MQQLFRVQAFSPDDLCCLGSKVNGIGCADSDEPHFGWNGGPNMAVPTKASLCEADLPWAACSRTMSSYATDWPHNRGSTRCAASPWSSAATCTFAESRGVLRFSHVVTLACNDVDATTCWATRVCTCATFALICSPWFCCRSALRVEQAPLVQRTCQQTSSR